MTALIRVPKDKKPGEGVGQAGKGGKTTERGATKKRKLTPTKRPQEHQPGQRPKGQRSTKKALEKVTKRAPDTDGPSELTPPVCTDPK